jgi:hypothetical protein
MGGLGTAIGSSNGLGTNAGFYYPTGVAVDYLGNVYVADQYNHLIREMQIKEVDILRDTFNYSDITIPLYNPFSNS